MEKLHTLLMLHKNQTVVWNSYPVWLRNFPLGHHPWHSVFLCNTLQFVDHFHLTSFKGHWGRMSYFLGINFAPREVAGSQREELCPWQRSWGRRLSICKGVIKPQETPCSQASTPKPESVLCSHLHLWLYGGLSPITVSLGEGINMQLQGNKNSWAWQESFSLRTALKVI